MRLARLAAACLAATLTFSAPLAAQDDLGRGGVEIGAAELPVEILDQLVPKRGVRRSAQEAFQEIVDGCVGGCESPFAHQPAQIAA